MVYLVVGRGGGGGGEGGGEGGGGVASKAEIEYANKAETSY